MLEFITDMSYLEGDAEWVALMGLEVVGPTLHLIHCTFGEMISPIFTPNQGWLVDLGLTAL